MNKTDPISKTTKEEYDIQTSLGTIRFDKYVDPYFFGTQPCLSINNSHFERNAKQTMLDHDTMISEF